MTHQFRLSKTRLARAALAACVLSLAGCGGDDDVEVSTDPPPPAPATTSVSGTVLGAGPLQAAKVCIDSNDNRLCDTGEVNTTTSASGAYTLTGVLASEATTKVLLAEATAGTTQDVDLAGAVAGSFTLAAPAGQSTLISPYTTLVVSEVDSGRSPNVAAAEEHILSFMVGIAGDVGGLTLQSSLLPDATDAAALVTRRARMYGLGQLLVQGYAKTRTDLTLTGKPLVAAYGQAAVGSLQMLLVQVPAGLVTTVAGTPAVTSAKPLSAADRDTLFNAAAQALVPSAATLAGVTAAAAKTAAAPIEGAWLRTTTSGGVTVKEVYLFAGDGTFVHQVADPGVPAATSTVFDNGYGYRYGRYTLNGTTLSTTRIEAANASGPGDTLNGVTIAGNTLTADGGITLTRVASATNPLVGGWVRPNGSSEPEYLVMFDDGTYMHSTFYYQNDPQTGTATYFETAKSAGVRKGAYTVDATNTRLVNFGATTVLFNGNLAIPSNPGVAVLQPDNSLSLTGLRLVKLGTTDGAKAVTGFSEATRARLWSGRYFSRTVSVAGVNRTQYVYVREPNDVLTFLQAPTGTSTADQALTCGTTAATTAPAADLTSVAPDDGKLKHFVVGTSTNATAGYAQRRFNIGQPGAFVTYTPITKPATTASRCVWPI